MLLFVRYLPVLTSLLIGLNFLLLHYKPKSIYYVIFFITLILSLSTFLIIRKSYNVQIKEKKIKALVLYLILPLLFTLSTLAFVIFFNQLYLYIIFVCICLFLNYIYYSDIFIYLYHPMKYHLESLDNIAEYISTLTIFLCFSSLYGFIIFVKADLWTLAAVGFAVVFLLTRHIIFINKISREKSNLFILIISLIIAESFSVTSQLPSSYFVNGIMIAIFYYVLMGIFKSYLLNTLSKKLTLRYILVGVIIIAGVLLTARWT